MNTLCYGLSLNVSAGLPSVSYTLSVVNDSSNTASLSEVNPINTLLLMTYLPFQNYSLAIKAKHVPHATASEILAELEWRVYTIWPSSILFSLCLESRRINGFTASATRGAIRLMCLSPRCGSTEIEVVRASSNVMVSHKRFHAEISNPPSSNACRRDMRMSIEFWQS